MQKMTPIERLGIGLATMGIGIALFMGLPPPWWADMPTSAVHFGVGLGIALICLGAFLALTSARQRSTQSFKSRLKRMWPQYLMAISGTLFFVGLVAFLQINATPPPENKPSEPLGFFAMEFVRLYDTPELRRKYVFDFLAPTNARFAFYLSPSDLFIFSATDVNNEQYSLEVPIGNDSIPLNRFIFLYCEVELHNNSTVLRILIDGKQVASRTLGIRLEFGKQYWEWKTVTIGADTKGQNNSPFKIGMSGNGHVPLSDTDVAALQQTFEKYLIDIDSPIQRR